MGLLSRRLVHLFALFHVVLVSSSISGNNAYLTNSNNSNSLKRVSDQQRQQRRQQQQQERQQQQQKNCKSNLSQCSTSQQQPQQQQQPQRLNMVPRSDHDTTSPANTGAAAAAGRLEELKQREAELSKLLAQVRLEKLSALRSRPLTIGVVGFGRFGQFIAKTFAKYGRVVVTSRSDYTAIAQAMNVKYVPLNDPDSFLQEGLDVIVLAVSILSFEETVQSLVPHIQKDLERRRNMSLGNSDIDSDGSNNNNNGNGGGGAVRGPLMVDVLSVKEHARQVMLDLLPVECDILCTHPMFGPDSGKDSWQGLNFVYEKTRIDKVILDPTQQEADTADAFVDTQGAVHSVHEDSEAHVEGVDRLERFLSIWEEEGCRMVPMSCRDHDAYAANSQFITHLMGRILGTQGLAPTPIDTRGFESVLKLIDSTTADSFDLFYGLYKYNQNSMDTILNLRDAMDDVVDKLKEMEDVEQKN